MVSKLFSIWLIKCFWCVHLNTTRHSYIKILSLFHYFLFNQSLFLSHNPSCLLDCWNHRHKWIDRWSCFIWMKWYYWFNFFNMYILILKFILMIFFLHYFIYCFPINCTSQGHNYHFLIDNWNHCWEHCCK